MDSFLTERYLRNLNQHVRQILPQRQRCQIDRALPAAGVPGIFSPLEHRAAEQHPGHPAEAGHWPSRAIGALGLDSFMGQRPKHRRRAQQCPHIEKLRTGHLGFGPIADVPAGSLAPVLLEL